MYSGPRRPRFRRAICFVKGCAGFGVVTRLKDAKTGRSKARVCAGRHGPAPTPSVVVSPRSTSARSSVPRRAIFEVMRCVRRYERTARLRAGYATRRLGLRALRASVGAAASNGESITPLGDPGCLVPDLRSWGLDAVVDVVRRRVYAQEVLVPPAADPGALFRGVSPMAGSRPSSRRHDVSEESRGESSIFRKPGRAPEGAFVAIESRAQESGAQAPWRWVE